MQAALDPAAIGVSIGIATIFALAGGGVFNLYKDLKTELKKGCKETEMQIEEGRKEIKEGCKETKMEIEETRKEVDRNFTKLGKIMKKVCRALEEDDD